MTTPAKETRPDQPRQLGDRKHVAKHVAGERRVDKYCKFRLYNNNGLFCECCGEKVDCHREDSIQSHTTTPTS